MSFWTTLLKGKDDTIARQQVKAAGVVRDEDGWYYEESQNFSRTQSTVRIEQRRPGEWQTLVSSCGITGLNGTRRKTDVERFFAGAYRWLRLERDGQRHSANRVVKIIGTYRDKAGKERAVHLGYLGQDVTDDIEGEDLRNLWARIRFIRFPSAGRDSKYLIRFDLMTRV